MTKSKPSENISYVKIDFIVTSDDERGNIYFFENYKAADIHIDEQGNTLRLQDGMPLMG